MIRNHSFKNAIFIGLFCSVLSACGGGGDGGSNNPTPPQQSPLAQAYLSEVLTIMRENAITRYDVDWGALETEVNQIASNATTISATYPAINRALELINTNHSFLNSPNGTLVAYPSTIFCEQVFDMDQPNEAGIGYVRVDAVSTRNTQEGNEIATDIQAQIAQRDSPDITAWVVDLRNNLGGNMWPMVAGLGPLFEGSTLGHFIDADENVTPWGYQNGRAVLQGNAISTVTAPYTLINPLPKIAVLSSRRVASSGEATLIAFQKQFDVRIFGTDSCGLSTGNSSYELSDGSTLFLTTSIMADRDQEKYGERVPVDQAVSPENVLAEAIAWLQM